MWPRYSWLSACPAASHLLALPLSTLDTVFKQLEPQQMQMHVLRVKSRERERETDRRERGVTDAEAARDTFTAAFKTNTCRRGRSAWGTSEVLQCVTTRLWLDNETGLTELEHYQPPKSSSLSEHEESQVKSMQLLNSASFQAINMSLKVTL